MGVQVFLQSPRPGHKGRQVAMGLQGPKGRLCSSRDMGALSLMSSISSVFYLLRYSLAAISRGTEHSSLGRVLGQAMVIQAGKR